MAEVAFEVLVTGRVQGVWFRQSTCDQARVEGVLGWVRNLPDGNVAAWLQGEDAAVERLHDWLHSGPPQARVDEVRAQARRPDPDLESFEIRD
ncbi:acylphosphatase [Marinobacterium nitratireducens]|uniref:Acylphosphatase n=1 Tax=Marinobacterium nitratireducens TaxID=518897 RepID=A0A918DPJ9_9GAMM|nr:acylphosphatase [Marinobacterium nitratireducens]GGO75733.1 acylphosphatase [Marinobacterium nitratireducens]